jgi:DNA mismatch repair protein MutS2
MRAEDALGEVESFLDRGMRSGEESALIIHGHGTGALRAAVRDELGRHPLVAHAEPAPPDQGGDGATIAHLAG